MPPFLALFALVLFVTVGVQPSVVSAQAYPGAPVSLWPHPTTVSFGSVAVSLDPATFRITPSPLNPPSALLGRAMTRYQSTIFSAALPVKGNTSATTPAAGLKMLTSLEVRILSNDENLRLGVDESYNLTVAGETGALIVAQTVFGAIYAIETFTQLVVKPRGEGGYVLQGTPVIVVDRPRFGWRGILHDTARHYYPVDFILHTIEALAANKMNVFQYGSTLLFIYDVITPPPPPRRN